MSTGASPQFSTRCAKRVPIIEARLAPLSGSAAASGRGVARGVTRRAPPRRTGLLAACMSLAAVALPAGTPTATAASLTRASRSAPAPRTTTSPWDIVPAPDPSGNWGPGSVDELNSVSCVSPEFCMAAGSYVPKPLEARAHRLKARVYRSFPLFERWDGSKWSVVPSPTGGGIGGISCSSAHFCMAVGVTNVPNGGPHQGETALAEVWRGAKWSVVTGPRPPAGVPAYDASVGSVSCTSRNSCLAVGSHSESGSPRTETLIESWDGLRWSVNYSPSPGGLPGGLNALSGVSCSAVGGSLCVAVGYEAANISSPDHAIIEVDHHGAWALDLIVGTAHAVSSHFYSVSCSSAARCVAVGNYGAGGSELLLEANRHPKSPTLVPTPPSAIVGVGVTCTSGSKCTEVGPTGKVSTWDGTSWEAMPTPLRTGVSASSISCAGSICMAVGDYVAGGMTHAWAEYRRQAR